MIPYMMICKAILESKTNESVARTVLEEEFNIKINGRDVIKLLERLRAKEDVDKVVYIDDEFLITLKEV